MGKQTKEYLHNLRQITLLAEQASWSYTRLFDYLRTRYKVNSKYALDNEQAIELCEYLKRQINHKPRETGILWQKLMTNIDE